MGRRHRHGAAVLAQSAALAEEVIRPERARLSGRAVERLGRLGLIVLISVINLGGAVAVVALAILVVPLPLEVADRDDIVTGNIILAAVYVVFAVPVGTWLGLRAQADTRQWLIEERPATRREQRTLIRAPLRLGLVQVTMWVSAALVFGTFNARYDGELGRRVLTTVALTGIVVAATSFFLIERAMRPAARRALAHGMPERFGVPGVATRMVMAWALGTAIPVAGLLSIGISHFAEFRVDADDLAVAMIVLSGISLTVGLFVIVLAARATAAPVSQVRRALERVRRGDFKVQVPVYDGTQVGQLQRGFNQMTTGLAERERIRAALGTYVDDAVAEHILEEGTNLGGEQVEVTVMFVDIRDFTGFASRIPAPEVVATLNGLFEQVVPIVHEHGGHIDKFIGDGVLAVYGAPRRRTDHADQALAAALEIAATVNDAASDGIHVGIGLNSGEVIAGSIGGAGRLEFSVIGDAVNVAARVEAATRQTADDILLTEQTRSLLRASDVVLTARPDIALKGKHGTVTLYAPDRGAATDLRAGAQVQPATDAPGVGRMGRIN